MPSAVVMAPTVTRSSLELMLDLIQKRDEQPRDAPPALPARPTSRGRLPSSRRSLPLNFRIGSIAPEPFSKSSEEGQDKKVVPKNRVFGSNKVEKTGHLEDRPFINMPENMPELESYEDSLGEVPVVDLASEEKFGCEHTVDKLLKKIANSEDDRHQSLQHIIGVQKYIRGFQARRHYEELKKGVTTLQSFIRGERARHQFEFVMKRWRAVIAIQKCVKGCISRRTFSNHKEGIVHIQSAVRGWLARKEFVILKNLKAPLPHPTNTNRSIQEMKDSNMGHLWVHHSVMEELQMRVLKAETLLRQKEEEHVIFQSRFEQYEAKMKSMEEMWQKQLMSLQNPCEKHSEAHQSVSAETQRQCLIAEVALRQKEEENFKLREELQQYEVRWKEYDVKMKSMEEMWQKQMASLQLSLSAARKSLAVDDLVNPPEKPVSPLVCTSYDSESTLSVEARSPEPTLCKQPQSNSIGVVGNPNDVQNEVSLLVKEFEQRKQVFEESTRFVIVAKSQQPSSCMNPDEELRRLKIQFASWEKDYKVRLREAKSAIRKLGNSRTEKQRKKWWFRGTT